MGKNPDNNPKKKRITKKAVQQTESKPFNLPTVDVHPEIDEDVPGADGLTIRQRLFVEAITGPAIGNATRAAEMAGYRSDNRVALASTAHENLRKPQIQEAIAQSLAKRKMTPEWARAALQELASASMANFLSVDSEGRPSIDWAKAAACGAIGQVREFREEGIDAGDGKLAVVKRSFKLYDRNRAIELLLKLYGMVTERHEMTGSFSHAHQIDLSKFTEDELNDILRIHDAVARRAGLAPASRN